MKNGELSVGRTIRRQRFWSFLKVLLFISVKCFAISVCLCLETLLLSRLTFLTSSATKSWTAFPLCGGHSAVHHFVRRSDHCLVAENQNQMCHAPPQRKQNNTCVMTCNDSYVVIFSIFWVHLKHLLNLESDSLTWETWINLHRIKGQKTTWSRCTAFKPNLILDYWMVCLGFLQQHQYPSTLVLKISHLQKS